MGWPKVSFSCEDVQKLNIFFDQPNRVLQVLRARESNGKKSENFDFHQKFDIINDIVERWWDTNMKQRTPLSSSILRWNYQHCLFKVKSSSPLFCFWVFKLKWASSGVRGTGRDIKMSAKLLFCWGAGLLDDNHKA